MAVSISSTPSLYSPAYNDIVFVVTSPLRTQANFRYIADVYVSGESMIRLPLLPHPTYGTGAFNVGRILETFVNSDISKSTYGFQQNLNSYKSFYVKFGEEYGAATSGTTVFPNQVTSSTIYAWNSEIPFLTFQDYDYTDYVAQPSGGLVATRLLTNQPTTVKIRDSEDAWMHVMSDTSGTVYYANVVTKDSAGATIQDIKIENPYQALTSTNHRFVRFGCGTANLNSIPSSGITGGSQPIITASVASYTLAFTKYTGSAVTNTQTFTIDNTCTKNVTYRFHFLNKVGGFDSFTFIRGSVKDVDIKRSNYKKVSGGLTSASTYGYNKYDRGDVSYFTQLRDGIKVKSDWLSESESDWLEELITSPEVYLDDATHGLVAVNIKNPNYKFKQTAQDKMIQLEIDFEYSFNRYRQRG